MWGLQSQHIIILHYINHRCYFDSTFFYRTQYSQPYKKKKITEYRFLPKSAKKCTLHIANEQCARKHKQKQASWKRVALKPPCHNKSIDCRPPTQAQTKYSVWLSPPTPTRRLANKCIYVWQTLVARPSPHSVPSIPTIDLSCIFQLISSFGGALCKAFSDKNTGVNWPCNAAIHLGTMTSCCDNQQ